MKRFSWILCCILLIPLMCACGNKKPEMQEPANFYYINNEISYNSSSGVIRAEVREAVSFRNDMSIFLRAYLQGPESSDLQTYIPSDTRMISCALNDDVADITFSEEFAKLTGTRLSAACSALLMSVHDFSGVNAIRIQAENGQLDDKDEIYMTIDDIVLLDPVPLDEQ